MTSEEVQAMQADMMQRRGVKERGNTNPNKNP